MVSRKPLPQFSTLPAGRILGLDYGKARIGVAVTDSHRRMATPIAVLEGTFAQQFDALQKLVKQYDVQGIIVGFPLNMDATPGAMADAAQSFAHEISQRLGLPVGLWDERLSSRQAEQAFFEQKSSTRQTRASKKHSVGKIDANAATLMLQNFLDALANSKTVA